jgi:GH18 family chitinase
MKTKQIFVLAGLFCLQSIFSQYNFPACYAAWVPGKVYNGGNQVSYNGINYTAKYWTTSKPGSGEWNKISPCGDGGLGPNYSGRQRIIGYLPTWIKEYNIKNDFKPETVTNVNISFLMFKQNNKNFASADFASIAFDANSVRQVDSVLTTCNVLAKARAKNVKVGVALGGATDFAFIWLMTKYYNNDAKLSEIATLIANYCNTKGIDGIDFDMECWWADPAIAGTTEQAGRVRGDKWGSPDAGPHPAGIGLRKLAAKVRALLPNKLLSAAVFGTSWFGNNYDDTMATSLDWIGLMTYDLTGSWAASPFGPHSSLNKLPLGKYPLQTADNPIYSAQDALEYWLGIAPAAWNHDGGFNVPKSKLVFGVPFYGYDFSTKKPTGGNGFISLTYKDIVSKYPNAGTSYDPISPSLFNGYIGTGGKKIYYDTPKTVTNKMLYSKNYGHQGIIVWELTQDAPYHGGSSLLKALDIAAGIIIPSFVATSELKVNPSVVFPTVVKDVVNFDVSGTNATINKIEFYTLDGTMVDEITTFDNSNKITKNVSQLNKGIYIYKIVTPEGVASGKIIKE